MGLEERFYEWLFEDGYIAVKITAFYLVVCVIYLVGVSWADLYEWAKGKVRKAKV